MWDRYNYYTDSSCRFSIYTPAVLTPGLHHVSSQPDAGCQHQAASKHQKARLKLDSIWLTKSDINDVVAFQADIGLLAATWISRWAQRPPPDRLWI